MNVDGVRCERRDDVLWLTLDRAGKRNAFDGAMLGALERALCELPPAVRAVVLTGSGTTFCAGADLEWMAGDGTLADGVRPECAAVLRFYALLDAVPVPVVARVNGVAAGGGVGLAAVADLAVAAEEATFQLSEVRVGLIPAMIGPYVARRIGPGRTREWALTAERIDAATALAWGLVSAVVPAARLDETVAAKLALLRAGGPEAVAAVKAFFRNTEGLTPAAAQGPAVRAISVRVASAEARERIGAFKRRSRRSPR